MIDWKVVKKKHVIEACMRYVPGEEPPRRRGVGGDSQGGSAAGSMIERGGRGAGCFTHAALAGEHGNVGHAILNNNRYSARNRSVWHYGLMVTNFFLSCLQISCIVWLPDIAAVGIPPPGLTHCPAI